MREVNKVNSISRIKPLPRIFPARERSPCPSAIAANGAPPPPTIAEKEEISITREVVTPTPPMHPYQSQGYDQYKYGRPCYKAN